MREQQRKLKELAKLKEEININFIQKGEAKEHMLSQDIVEIDGMHLRQNMVGAIGGFLGQFIICFHTIFKHWNQEVGAAILAPKIIQNFLFLYIDQKMKTEKMILQVGQEVELFLNSLEKPLQLNEMRVMKESNYIKFRQILSDPACFGDQVLRMFADFNECEYLMGVDSFNVFKAVYESFWDLYCKKPQTQDINIKKLDGFIQKVKLIVNPPVQNQN